MWAYAAVAVLLVRASVESTPQALTAPGQAGTKVAVLLSGALRTLDWCTESLRTNLVEANPGMTFDFFAYLTADDGVDRGAMERSVDASLRNVSGTEPKVRVVTESEALAAVMQALMPSMQKLPAGRGTATGKGRNIIQMFYGTAGAATLLSETAGGDGPKSKLQTCDGADGGAEATTITAKYDLILRTRPDLCLCKPLDLHQVHEDSASAVHVPWFNLWEERSPPACNYAFDQIALGRVAPMMRYVNGFANVCEQVKASKELYPEHVMGLHLTRAGLSLKTLGGFHGALARADENSSVPTITYVDPYAKLKQDIDDPLSGLGCLREALALPDWDAALCRS
jgi:hypothetical protein